MRTLLTLFAFASLTRAAEPTIADFLKKEIVGPRQTLVDVQEYVDAKIPRLKVPATAEEWTKEAERIRQDVLTKVVFRGEATKWRDYKAKVEWLDTIDGGPGYRIKKVRYEILPDFWIPALLYEPEKLDGKHAMMMAVNGHDGKGKAADYKQTRCINLAKRGMIVLNVEWLGMGQLRAPGYRHGCMNQLDLCGSSGIAPFYLSMSRGLDILLAHKNADPARVAVSGLSGGGWQTIFISSLDTRVTLTNPVAGYSSFRTRIQHFKDLGDSEQTPCDLGTVADYATLTAMMAPRPTLLTYNSKDNCCFEAGYALPPLYDGSMPYFKLYGKEASLRKHINDVPGDHNFGKDNRQALYKMIGDHFFAGDKNWSSDEIECAKEIKTAEQLNVPLPENTLDFNKLAKKLAEKLPDPIGRPEKGKLLGWQKECSMRLFFVVLRGPVVGPNRIEKVETIQIGDTESSRELLKFEVNRGGRTLPFCSFVPKGSNNENAILLLHDGGRKELGGEVSALVAANRPVFAFDPFYIGESRPNPKDWLWALMLDTVGTRPLGLQTIEAGEMARVVNRRNSAKPVTLRAIGPKSSVIALLAAGQIPELIGSVELVDPLPSFKQVIDDNRTVQEMPELFCYGFLEDFDVADVAALVAPRPIKIEKASERAAKEFGALKEWYEKMGGKIEIVK